MQGPTVCFFHNSYLLQLKLPESFQFRDSLNTHRKQKQIHWTTSLSIHPETPCYKRVIKISRWIVLLLNSFSRTSNSSRTIFQCSLLFGVGTCVLMKGNLETFIKTKWYKTGDWREAGRSIKVERDPHARPFIFICFNLCLSSQSLE